MKEAYDDAVNELKRVDHLLYVSLKYTRTVDVIRSVIDRIIATLDNVQEVLLRYAKKKKNIPSIPTTPGLRSEAVISAFGENEAMVEMVNFYLLLRKIMRSKYTKREEFRRHVTMITMLDTNEKIEVNIDLLARYYELLKDYMKLVKEIIEGKKEE
jgi:hypothetical protein